MENPKLRKSHANQKPITFHIKNTSQNPIIFHTNILFNADNITQTTSIKNRKHFTEFVVSKGSEYELIGELQDLDTRKKGILKKKVTDSSRTRYFQK